MTMITSFVPPLSLPSPDPWPPFNLCRRCHRMPLATILFSMRCVHVQCPQGSGKQYERSTAENNASNNAPSLLRASLTPSSPYPLILNFRPVQTQSCTGWWIGSRGLRRPVTPSFSPRFGRRKSGWLRKRERWGGVEQEMCRGGHRGCSRCANEN